MGTKRLLLALALVLVPAVASAAGPADGGLLATIFNVDTWLAEMETYTDDYQRGFNTVAYALAALGFVASLTGVLLRGSVGGLNDTFLRLLAATALIALTPQITDLSLATWQGLRAWNGGEMEESFRDGAAEMQQLGTDAGVLALGLTGVASGALRVSGAAAAQAAAQGAASSAMTLLNVAVVPVAMIALIAHFIILGAGVAILLGCSFLPVSAGMLAFSPQQGGEWLGRIVGAVVSALVVTAFMPLVFKAGFDLLVVQPVAAVNAEFREFRDYFDPQVFAAPPRLAAIESERQAILTEIGEVSKDLEAGFAFTNLGVNGRLDRLNFRLTALNAEALRVRGEWTLGMLRERTSALEAIAGEVKRWFVRLAVFFIATLMASGLTWWGARAAAGLVGGVVAGKVKELPSLGGSLLGGGRGAGGGGAPVDAGGNSGSPSGGYAAGGVAPRFSSGPSDGGGRTYSPPANASVTAPPPAGAATASYSTAPSGPSSSTTAAPAGRTSSTRPPELGGVSRT